MPSLMSGEPASIGIFTIRTKFVLAFLTTTLVSIVFLGQTLVELWRRDCDDIAQETRRECAVTLHTVADALSAINDLPEGGAALDAWIKRQRDRNRAAALKRLRSLEVHVEPTGPAVEVGDFDPADAPLWVLCGSTDSLPVPGQRDYPVLRRWLAQHPAFSHLVLLDPKGDQVWSDVPLASIKGDDCTHLDTALRGCRNWMPIQSGRKDGCVEVQRVSPGITPENIFIKGLMVGIKAPPARYFARIPDVLKRIQNLGPYELAFQVWKKDPPTPSGDDVLREDTPRVHRPQEAQNTERVPYDGPVDFGRLPFSGPSRFLKSIRLESTSAVPWKELISTTTFYLPRPSPGDPLDRLMSDSNWLCFSQRSTFGPDDYQCLLSLAIRQTDALAAVRTRQVALVGRFALVLLCTLLVAFSMAGWIRRPITNLTEAAVQLAQDGIARHIPVRGQDELAVLTRAFNTMAQQVDGRMQEANRELANKNEKLVSLHQLKNDFFAGISHDLKTPLSRIRGNAELLDTDPIATPTDLRSVLGAIVTNVDLLNGLVDKILDVSRLELEKPVLKLSQISLSSLIDRVVARFQGDLKARHLDLTTHLDDVDDTVTADEDKIDQVLTNLLDNAIKYTPPGAAIQVRLLRRGGDLEAHVSDSGPGLDASELIHVFDKFYRGARREQRSVPGAGLGLYLVKYMVELHGGSVRAESEGPGRGSTFVVALPAQGAAGTA
jgi:signal transduction histidine kinase